MMCHNPLEIAGFLLNGVQYGAKVFAEIRCIFGVCLGVFDLYQLEHRFVIGEMTIILGDFTK